MSIPEREVRRTIPALPEPQPLPVSTEAVILAGIGLWAVALVVTLVVPALHHGTRHWWPWACLAGAALGVVGYLYVRRGRGNAADAHPDPQTRS